MPEIGMFKCRFPSNHNCRLVQWNRLQWLAKVRSYFQNKWSEEIIFSTVCLFDSWWYFQKVASDEIVQNRQQQRVQESVSTSMPLFLYGEWLILSPSTIECHSLIFTYFSIYLYLLDANIPNLPFAQLLSSQKNGGVRYDYPVLQRVLLSLQFFSESP